MFSKAVVVLAIVAAASAGVVYDSPHVGAQSEQTVRGLGYAGLSTISSQSKAVDSAFSSVRKHDTRVINPALRVGPAVAYAPAAYAAPAHYAAPVAAPVQYAAAPVAAPVQYAAAAPVVAKAAVPAAGLLGVAYSAVPQVAHLTFDGFGVHYGY